MICFNHLFKPICATERMSIDHNEHENELKCLVIVKSLRMIVWLVFALTTTNLFTEQIVLRIWVRDKWLTKPNKLYLSPFPPSSSNLLPPVSQTSCCVYSSYFFVFCCCRILLSSKVSGSLENKAIFQFINAIKFICPV